MGELGTYTLIYRHGGSHLQLYRVCFELLGAPFVTDCSVAGSVYSLIPLWQAVQKEAGGEKEALGKTFAIKLRGTMYKRHFTREERRESKLAAIDILDANTLPPWRWEFKIQEITRVQELHWLKEPWFGVPAIVYIFSLLALMLGGVGSCIRNW